MSVLLTVYFNLLIVEREGEGERGRERDQFVVLSI